VPEPRGAGGTGKAQSHNPVAYADEKSDTFVVPEKPSNKGKSPMGEPAEMASVRSVAKGNARENPAARTPHHTNATH
jgi:RNA-directed DNA polymerase